MDKTWLTQDAFDKLKAELEHRAGEFRDEIKNRIAAAREEGDLKENGGYHAAREEQGKNEARVKQLLHMLENAIVGVAPASADDGKVAQGMEIEIEFVDFGDTETFLLGSREAAAHSDIEVYSPTSALGAALLGQEVGSEVTYTAPNGKQIKVKIRSAKPYQG